MRCKRRPGLLRLLSTLAAVLTIPSMVAANDVPDLATYVRTLRQEVDEGRQTIRALRLALAGQEQAWSLPDPSTPVPSRKQSRIGAFLAKANTERDHLSIRLTEREQAYKQRAAEVERLREQVAVAKANGDEIVMLRQQLAELQAAYDASNEKTEGLAQHLEDHLAQRETLTIVLENLREAQAHLAQNRRLIEQDQECAESLSKQLAQTRAAHVALAQDAERSLVEATRELSEWLAQFGYTYSSPLTHPQHR